MLLKESPTLDLQNASCLGVHPKSSQNLSNCSGSESVYARINFLNIAAIGFYVRPFADKKVTAAM